MKKLLYLASVCALFAACNEYSDEDTSYIKPFSINTSNLKTAGNAVDLGLSVKWADMNVGAKTPEDFGVYFGWGDVTGTLTSEKNGDYALGVTPSVNDLFEMYKGNQDAVKDTTVLYSKEISLSANVKAEELEEDEEIILANLDHKTALEVQDALATAGSFIYYTDFKPADKKVTINVGLKGYVYSGSNAAIAANSIIGDVETDAALANWGGKWRVPTAEQCAEILSCAWEATTMNGVNGYTVTGPNGNSIFLPAAGYRQGEGVVDQGNSAFYYSGEIAGTYVFPTVAEQPSGYGAISEVASNPTCIVGNYQYKNLSSTNKITLGKCAGMTIRPVLVE